MQPALFERYPVLAERLARVPLVAGPTPVHRLASLGQRTGAAIWAKRDDLTARPFGGNKPRKLEFLLGAARARGARTLITFGGLGSNHALATALYGRQHGFAVHGILVPQPVDDRVRQNLLALAAQGARLTFAPTAPHAALGALAGWCAALAAGRRPYLIPPGGSSAIGTLGYVSAALELADQVARGEAPRPDAVFVAGGSSGTAAGLLLGLRLAGLPARLVVVRVSDRVLVNAAAIARLARATAALLRRAAPGELPDVGLAPADLEVWSDYLGPGYGHPTAAGDRARALLAETEGLQLEPVYTAKTMAALLDAAARPDWRGRTLLYWHTCNEQPLAPLLPDDPASLALPRPLRALAHRAMSGQGSRVAPAPIKRNPDAPCPVSPTEVRECR